MAKTKKKKEQAASKEAQDEEAPQNEQDDVEVPGIEENGKDEAAAEEAAEDEEETSDDEDEEAVAEEEAADKEESDEEKAEGKEKAEEGPAGESAKVPEDASIEVDFSTYPADTYEHDDLGFSDEDVVEMYRNMLLQRRFEMTSRQMYQRQKVSGFLHLYIGQEAVSTGAIAAIRLGEDSVITAYRDHGMALAMEMSPDACMAELFGKKTGCSKGKGGSMHFFDSEKRMFGGHGIVGAGIPLGVGIAFAHKYRGDEEICLCFFGDGAVNQGAFHEAANLASLYDLPVVMICENNQYGMGTHIERAMAESAVYRHAVSYDMPGGVVNGMDVFSVNKAVSEHAEMARENQPSLLEVRTYRYQGHSISDPADYRAEGELDERKEQDAILRLKKYVLDHDLSDNDALDEMDDEIKQQVKDTVKFAEESDFPDEDAIYQDVYTQEDYPFITD